MAKGKRKRKEEAVAEKDAEVAAQEQKTGKNKYRRDKPWDHDGIEHWKPVEIKPEDAPKGGLLTEESSFATLFPAYREQYLKQVWPDVKNVLKVNEINAELNLIEGSMTVKTTRKTWDPYAIVKARDFIKLLARSVPFPQASKIMEDEQYSDIIKISGFVRNKERFVKRRQRLVGPNGSTLKAIELLTECFMLVQGQTVCIMGSIKGIKSVRRIVEDCFKNIHPIYHIKELMIRRELEKDPELKNENWDRFLPKFKKRNVQTKKKVKKRKPYEAFPPEQAPRKVDLQMESGEYFLEQKEREMKEKMEKYEQQKARTLERKKERNKAFEAPSEAVQKAKKKPRNEGPSQESAKDLAKKLQAKGTAAKKSEAKKARTGADLLL